MSDDSQEQCNLFGDFGYIVQFALGVVCFFSLILKWLKEENRRTGYIFFLDISKQGFSAWLAHIMNLMIAVFFATQNHENPCIWYFINLMIDTTMGVFVAWTFIRTVQKLALHYEWEMMQSGHYIREGAPGEESSIDLSAWATQLIVWNTIIITTKSLLGGFQFLFQTSLGLGGAYLFEGLENYPRIELVLVMFVIPLIMNCFQFWVQDSFLKKSHTDGERMSIRRRSSAIGSLQSSPAKSGKGKELGP